MTSRTTSYVLVAVAAALYDVRRRQVDLAAQRRLAVDPAELGRVTDGVDPRDPSVLDHEAQGGVVPVVDADDPGADRAVEQHRQDLGGWGEPGERPEQVGDLLGADDRSDDSLGDPATVGDEHDVRSEHLHQCLQVPTVDGGEKTFHDGLLLRGADLHPRPPRGHVLPRPVPDLAYGGRGLLDG